MQRFKGAAVNSLVYYFQHRDISVERSNVILTIVRYNVCFGRSFLAAMQGRLENVAIVCALPMLLVLHM